MAKANTIDDFVAKAKKNEATKKTLDYYNKMIQQSNPTQRTSTPCKLLKPTLKKVGMTFIQKSHPRGNTQDISENQRLFIKLKEPHNKGVPMAHQHRFCNNAKPPHMRDPSLGPQAKSLRCFKCGGLGHWADKCRENEKDQVQAAHTEKPKDLQNGVEEQADSDKSSAHGSHASHDTNLTDDEEYVEMDVYEQNSFYERETDTKFLTPMFDVGDHCNDTMATLTNKGTVV